MSLSRAYELGLFLATSLALLMILLGGELPVVFWATLSAPAIAMAMRARKRVVPLSVGTAIAIAGTAWGLVSVLQRGIQAIVLAGGLMLAGLLAGRILTSRTLGQDLQALLISLLMVFSGTILHTQLSYGPVFVCYAVAAVWALIARQLVVGAEREAARPGGAPLLRTLARRDVITPAFLGVTGSIAVAMLLSTLVVFVLFPRFGMGTLTVLKRGAGGLPRSVSLVGVSRAGGGGRVLARVRGIPYEEFRRGLYLRGPTYDRLDRAGFSTSTPPPNLPAALGRLARPETKHHYEVFMQPIAGRRLLNLGPVDDAALLAGGSANPSYRNFLKRPAPPGELLTVRSLSGPVRYWVSGRVSRPLMAVLPATETEVAAAALAAERQPEHLAAFLELPQNLDPRIHTLAETLAEGATTPAEKASRIQDFLLRMFEYSLDLPNSNKEDPLAGFLFDDRRGHCEYFATAFAALLRLAGVPTRVVGGFQGGRWDDSDEVVVFRESDAHVWVEWHDPRFGWVTDDATPAIVEPPREFAGFAAMLERVQRAWDDYVLEYNLITQVEIFRQVTDTFRGSTHVPVFGDVAWRKVGYALAISMTALVILLLLLRLARSRRSRAGEAGSDATQLGRALAAAVGHLRGDPVSPHETLRRAVRLYLGGDPVRVPPQAAEQLTGALDAYEAARFGGAVLDAQARQRHMVELRRLRRRRAA